MDEAAGAEEDGPSTLTLGSRVDWMAEAGGVGAGAWPGVAAGPFPTATGGGMSPSSMAFPFRTEASRFSSVWENTGNGFQRSLGPGAVGAAGGSQHGTPHPLWSLTFSPRS